MKHITRSALVVASLALAACGGGGGSGDTHVALDASAGVHIECADVYNGATSPRCDPQPVALLDLLIPAAHAVTVTQGGTVSRSALEEVGISMDVANPLEVARDVLIELKFDKSCIFNEPGPQILAYDAVQVAAGQTYAVRQTRMCASLELGARTLTGTVYDADGVTVLDVAIVEFTVIE